MVGALGALVASRFGSGRSAWEHAVQLLDKQDEPQPITGIEQESIRLIGLRKGKNKGNTSQ